MSNNNSQKSHSVHSHHTHHHSHSRRNTSYTKLSIVAKAHHRPGLPRALSSPRVASLGKKRTPSDIEDALLDDEDDTMASTFLQYCATCEKQIVVPNHSILYCSERCRHKDTGNSSETSLPLSPHHSPPLPPLESSSLPLVPRREPSTIATLGHKPHLLHSAKADLDPTEWKPDTLSRSEGRNRSSTALNFLAQFYREPETVMFAGEDCASTSLSDTDSGPGTPQEGFASTEPVQIHSALGGGSTASLKSLAVAADGRDGEGLAVHGDVWATDKGPGKAKGSLKRLLQNV